MPKIDKNADKKSIAAPQRQRFIEAAREAGCSEDENDIRDMAKRIASAKVEKPKARKK